MRESDRELGLARPACPQHRRDEEDRLTRPQPVGQAESGFLTGVVEGGKRRNRSGKDRCPSALSTHVRCPPTREAVSGESYGGYSAKTACQPRNMANTEIATARLPAAPQLIDKYLFNDVRVRLSGHTCPSVSARSEYRPQRRMVRHHRGRSGRDLGKSPVRHDRQPARQQFRPLLLACDPHGKIKVSVKPFRTDAGSSPHQANCAPCPACAMAFPAVMGSSGFSQSTGVPGAGSPGGRGSSRSVPDTCSLARSAGQSSTGTGGYTRTSADRVRHGDPRQRARPLPGRAARPPDNLPDPCVLPCPGRRGPFAVRLRDPRVGRNRSTACAAPSSASVLAGGAARSTRMTSGSANCGPSSLLASCILQTSRRALLLRQSLVKHVTGPVWK